MADTLGGVFRFTWSVGGAGCGRVPGAHADVCNLVWVIWPKFALLGYFLGRTLPTAALIVAGQDAAGRLRYCGTVSAREAPGSAPG